VRKIPDVIKIGQREPVGLGQYNKSIEFFHLGYFVPGHRALMCNPSLRIKCYLSHRIEPMTCPVPFSGFPLWRHT
jgi:hypothetical protein